MAPLALAKDPPLFLKPLLPFEEYTTVRITYTHTVPAVAGPPAVAPYDITRKRDVPFCPDSSDKERLLRVIDEYLETCPDNILHIHDADRYENFRQIIGGSMKTLLTQIVNEDRPNPAQHTDHNFLIDVRTFVRRHCPSNAADLFKTYLADPKTVKPNDFDCYETRSRLELLNKLTRFLPGAGGDPIFITDLSLRNAFFQLMLDPWQLKFTENGNSTEDPMTLDRMVDFFEQQRIHYNARQGSPRRSRGTYSGRPYDHRPFPYRFNPGRGGYDQRLGNPYRNNSPNRFGRGGGGGRSPGGRAPLYSPGFHTPRAPNPARGFPRGGGQARGGVGGRRIRQPGGGLRPNPAQRQLGFFQQQDNFYGDMPPQLDPHSSSRHDESSNDDFIPGDPTQFMAQPHSHHHHPEDNYHIDNNQVDFDQHPSSQDYPSYDDSHYFDPDAYDY